MKSAILCGDLQKLKLDEGRCSFSKFFGRFSKVITHAHAHKRVVVLHIVLVVVVEDEDFSTTMARWCRTHEVGRVNKHWQCTTHRLCNYLTATVIEVDN